MSCYEYFPHASKSKKEVALTFDDGPNPYATNEILDILDQYRIKGSFFLIGNRVEQFPSLVKEIIKRDHLVGSHSYNHTLPVKMTNLRQGDLALKQCLGETPRFMRFPFGIRNNLTSAGNWSGKYFKDKKIIDFSLSSGDWKYPTHNAITQKVLQNVQKGSVIDFHDGSEKDDQNELKTRPQELIKALPAIIEGLTERGFQFKRVDEMDFKESRHLIITSSLLWDGQKHQLVYTDSDSFESLPQEKIKQVYGVCFYNGKLVIGLNSETQLWNFQGGSLKEGEGWREALSREIIEESNMKLVKVTPLGYQLSINPEGKVIYQLRTACELKPLGEFKEDPDGAVTKIKLIPPESYDRYIQWVKMSDHLVGRSIAKLGLKSLTPVA